MNNRIEVNTVKPAVDFFENELSNRLISIESESLLDSNIESCESYMKDNPITQDVPEGEVDKLYESAKSLYSEFVENFKGTKFNFYLNRPQYNLLTDILIKKLEYDVNTVFVAIELTELLGKMADSKYKNDTDLIQFELDSTQLVYMYHLIQTHKVKGLTKEAYTFAKLLIRFGDVSKLINYYDTCAKNLSGDIQSWVAMIPKGGVVSGETLSPVIEEVEVDSTESLESETAA
jgi:hypothetical protein